MFTDREQKLINWLHQVKIATMRHLRHQFQISHMTVVRALKKFGYYASYNHNAAYYVLEDVPEFDDWGLWTYRNVGFSRHGNLPQTIIAVVEKASAGLTVRELEERLQSKVGNLVSRLVGEGRLQRERLVGRQVVYLASALEASSAQLQERRQQLQEEAAWGKPELPSGCSATEVIEVLRAIILTRDDNADRLARRFHTGGRRITAGQVRRILDHYGLKKKRRL